MNTKSRKEVILSENPKEVLEERIIMQGTEENENGQMVPVFNTEKKEDTAEVNDWSVKMLKKLNVQLEKLQLNDESMKRRLTIEIENFANDMLSTIEANLNKSQIQSNQKL